MASKKTSQILEVNDVECDIGSGIMKTSCGLSQTLYTESDELVNKHKELASASEKVQTEQCEVTLPSSGTSSKPQGGKRRSKTLPRKRHKKIRTVSSSSPRFQPSDSAPVTEWHDRPASLLPMVLNQKKLELMNSPSVKEFLQQQQQKKVLRYVEDNS